MALMLLAQRQPRVEGTVGVITTLAPLFVGFILFDRYASCLPALISPSLTQFALLLNTTLRSFCSVGCAVAAILSRFLWRTKWLAAICTIVVIYSMIPYGEDAWNHWKSNIAVAPTSFLNSIQHNPAFKGYWDALRQTIPPAGTSSLSPTIYN